jgi:hypothetical protein
LRAGVLSVLDGAHSGAQNVKKLVRRMTQVVLPWNNERRGKTFPPENRIKNLWVVIFNLWFVPNNLPLVINNLPDAPNNLPFVLKNLPSGQIICQMP